MKVSFLFLIKKIKFDKIEDYFLKNTFFNIFYIIFHLTFNPYFQRLVYLEKKVLSIKNY